MARRKSKSKNSKNKQKKTLEHYLILNHYMCSLFGAKNFKELKENFKNTGEGYAEDGHSHMYHTIIGLDKLDPQVREKMDTYDINIKGYLEHINRKREFKVTLKYFQYLAVLFTEIYLDFYFQDPISFMNELTKFAYKRVNNYGNNLNLIAFIPRNLTNLAFWMATGSGKTLIMHINYLQFIKYNKGPHKIDYENFILITPNAGLTNQHMKELQLSSIPCMYFLDSEKSLAVEYPVVKVIEITKFTGEKKGEGVRIDPRSFGSKNIVFADEAHKGTSGDVWRSYREDLSKDGFKFEYSATFGQALKGSNINPENELLQTYAKSIIFDYSYKYFYGDGYGKDYRIINTKTLTDELRHIFLLGNAISFYEQLKVFESDHIYEKIYNLDRPLWVFVGSTVQQKNKNNAKTQTMSDILKVVVFLHKFLNDDTWAIKNIKRILNGNSGILDKEGNDVFARTYPETKYPYLRSRELRSEDIYDDMLEKIFKSIVKGTLHLVDIKNADGEIGLKVGPFGKYFGVINIGDKAGFLKYIKENYKEEGIIVESDDTTSSLFEGLEKSDVDILIGARKFVEGWNSWRVSTMGLIHMGKGEGPLIIQLFGRGVRLKGYKKLLKRSTAISDVPHPDHIQVLETLTVFGIEANYMELFRGYLEKEGVPTEPQKEFEIPTKLHQILEEETHDLHIPRIEKGRNFIESHFIHLNVDRNLSNITIDLRPRATVLVSKEEEGIKTSQHTDELHIKTFYLDLLNWDYIYSEILEFKRERGWYNLLITKEILKSILLPDEYGKYVYDLLLPDSSKIQPNKLKDMVYLENLVILILKNYITKFYNTVRFRWERNNLTYYKLTTEDKNFFEKYIIKIQEKDLQLFEDLVNLLESKNYDPLYGEYDKDLKNVYIDVHLYQPLLEDNDKITITPRGLNKGEVEFICSLKEYLRNNQEYLRNNNIHIYVLRNRTRGKGVGFFEAHGFYPDFIVWIKKENLQHILFIEPHGLAHFSERDKEKLELHKRIKDLESELSKKTGKNITLDSYIISVTEYKDIKHIFAGETKESLKKKHLLFKEDRTYISDIFDNFL